MAQSPDRSSTGKSGGGKSGADKPKKVPKATPGVRGPSGPPPPPSARGSQQARPGSRTSSSGASGGSSDLRKRFETISYPFIQAMSKVPRWIVVVLPAVILLLGLLQTGSLAWLGGILLLIIWALLAWLTALSWPAITGGSRILRVIVLAALLGIIAMKFAGRI
ncbi:MAG: hypothetical protein IPO93_13620 [Actinobacteria bacterium]|jgi:hypothetical protein|nr:hypothetical protein [Actinomycetota bacterium]